MLTLGMVPQYLWAEGTATEEAPELHPPGDYRGWERLVEDTVLHCKDEGLDFGYYEVWNEPAAKNFWKGTFDEYLEFYAHTAKAVKRANPSAKVGGPAYIWGADELMIYCHENGLPLDFLSYHLYSAWPENFGRITELMRRLLRRFPEFEHTELVFNEWSYGWFSVAKVAEYSNSPFKGAHCAETLYQMLEAGLDKGGYWRPAADAPATGLFTEEGVPKPAYNAFRLLSMLRGNRVETAISPSDLGINGLASRSEDEVVILLWWYLPERYDLKRVKRVSLQIENVRLGERYTCERYVIDGAYSNYNVGTQKAELECVSREQVEAKTFRAELDMELYSMHLFRLVKRTAAEELLQ